MNRPLHTIALLLCWLNGAVPACGQDAAIEAELAAVEREIVITESAIEELRLGLDWRAARSDLGDEVLSEAEAKKAALKEEVVRVDGQIRLLGELLEYTRAEAGHVAKAVLELERYLAKLRRLDKDNKIKTLLRLGMETAMEVKDFASGRSGKVVEIGKWAAEKVGSEATKEFFTGGDEYYSLQLKGLSSAAAATTPEMQRLADLATLSLTGWQSYLAKYEDKEITGSNAQILAKGRLLLEHGNKALDSLIKLHRRLENTAHATELEIGYREEQRTLLLERLAGMDAEIEAERQAVERVDKGSDGVQAQLRELEAELAQLRDRKAELEAELAGDPPTRDEVQAAEQAMERYRARRAAYIEAHGGYVARAAQLAEQIDAVNAAEQVWRALPQQWERERDEVAKWTLENPTYPYNSSAEPVTDETALNNLRTYREKWMAALRRHEGRMEEQLSVVADAGNQLAQTLEETPDDPWSEAAQREAMNRAAGAAATLIHAELKAVRSRLDIDYPARLQREGVLDALRDELERLRRETPANPFGALTERAEGTVTYLFEKELPAMRKGLLASIAEREATEREHKSQETAYKAEIAEAARAYRRAANGFMHAANLALSDLAAYGSAMGQLLNFYRQQVSAGILVEKQPDSPGGPARFGINREWTATFLGDTHKDCRAIERLRNELEPLAARGNALLAKATSAHGQAAVAVTNGPLSEWAAVNEPALYASVEAMVARLADARERLMAIGNRPPPNPFASINGLVDGSTLVQVFPDIMRGLQTSHRDLSALIGHGIQHAEILAKRERLRAEDLPEAEKWLKRAQGEYDQVLSCMGEEFILSRDVLARLTEFEAAVDKLKRLRKPTYADAESLIERFETLLQQVNGLQMSHELSYRNQVEALVARATEAANLFEHQREAFAGNDVDTLQRLHYDLFERLRPHQEEARRIVPTVDNTRIQQLYQSFIDAYGRGDLRGLLALLAPDWQGGDGSDLRDVEEYLTNSFRVFDRIQYRISGFSARHVGDGRAQVTYTVTIRGENRRQRLTHEESSRVVEEVGLVDGKPVILRTLSGSQWLR